MSKVTITAKTVQEAVKLALNQLQAREAEVHIRVIEEPSKGFLGFGAKPAVVEVEVKDQRQEITTDTSTYASNDVLPVHSQQETLQTETVPASQEEALTLEQAQAFLTKVLHQMGVENIELTVNKAVDHVLLTIEGSELGTVIGRRGQTLDALQYLTNSVANRGQSRFTKIILDAENYRQRRRESLEKLAERLAKKVLRTGTKVMLEPMNPAERKIIHSYLQEYPGVETKSEGQEPYRKVIVYPQKN